VVSCSSVIPTGGSSVCRSARTSADQRGPAGGGGPERAAPSAPCAHSHTVTQSHSHTVTQSHSHTDTQSHSHTVTQSHSHTVTQSHSHTVTQSHRPNERTELRPRPGGRPRGGGGGAGRQAVACLHVHGLGLHVHGLGQRCGGPGREGQAQQLAPAPPHQALALQPPRPLQEPEQEPSPAQPTQSVAAQCTPLQHGGTHGSQPASQPASQLRGRTGRLALS
jgi:hypothetical protein